MVEHLWVEEAMSYSAIVGIDFGEATGLCEQSGVSRPIKGRARQHGKVYDSRPSYISENHGQDGRATTFVGHVNPDVLVVR